MELIGEFFGIAHMNGVAISASNVPFGLVRWTTSLSPLTWIPGMSLAVPWLAPTIDELEVSTKFTSGESCFGLRSRISASANVCAVTGSPVLNLYLPGRHRERVR